MIRKGRIGAVVRLKHRVRRGFQTARIERVLQGDFGGVVLDRQLDGLRYWNVEDLVYVKRSSSRSA